jgi:hypothetical protein
VPADRKGGDGGRSRVGVGVGFVGAAECDVELIMVACGEVHSVAVVPRKVFILNFLQFFLRFFFKGFSIIFIVSTY